MSEGSKTVLARALGLSRSTLYYVSRKDRKDWALKVRMEEILREHPSYGSRRIAQALHRNRKGVQRVMRRFRYQAIPATRKKMAEKASDSHPVPQPAHDTTSCVSGPYLGRRFHRGLVSRTVGVYCHGHRSLDARSCWSCYLIAQRIAAHAPGVRQCRVVSSTANGLSLG